jgi:RND family efflux transporter MFP subunit
VREPRTIHAPRRRTAWADHTPATDDDAATPRWVRAAQVLIALVVLAGAAVAVYSMMSSQPTAGTDGAAREERPVLADVVRADRAPAAAVVEAYGEVVPAERVELAPRVSGEVVEVSPRLEAGGRVAKGEVLAQLDRSDYEIALEQARTDLAKARANLKIEQGNQAVAKTEAELLGEDLSAQERALVLREPQLESAQADVAAAKADVERARLDLERTTIRAPFDAVVQRASIEVGSQVSVGQTIAELVGTARYYVDLAVPAAKLQYIVAAEDTPGQGSKVVFDNPSVWPESETRTGEVLRVRPDLTEEGRMAQIRVAVPEPLDRNPRMLVGAYLRARIQGAPLGEVVALDRAYLRENETVWVMTAEDRLEMRAVSIAYRGPEHVYVDVGLAEGDRIVTSDIATPTSGMRLRTREDGAGRGDAVASTEGANG